MEIVLRIVEEYLYLMDKIGNQRELFYLISCIEITILNTNIYQIKPKI